MPIVSAFLPGPGIAVGSLTAAADTVTGSVIFQAFFTWLTAVLAIFWIGGWIFQTLILSPTDVGADPYLHATADASGRRFQLVVPYALVGFLVANVGLLLAESVTMAGGRLDTVSPLLVSRVLFGSRFGLAWWLRELIVVIALAVTLSAARREEGMPESRVRSRPSAGRVGLAAPGLAPGAARSVSPIAAAAAAAGGQCASTGLLRSRPLSAEPRAPDHLCPLQPERLLPRRRCTRP